MHVNIDFELENQPEIVDIVHSQLVHPFATVNHETKDAADVQIDKILGAFVLYVVLVGVESSNAHAEGCAHVVDAPDFDRFLWARGFVHVIIAVV